MLAAQYQSSSSVANVSTFAPSSTAQSFPAAELRPVINGHGNQRVYQGTQTTVVPKGRELRQSGYGGVNQVERIEQNEEEGCGRLEEPV